MNRLALCLPSGGLHQSRTAADIARLVAFTAPSVPVDVHGVESGYSSWSREGLVRLALATDCTHLLWIDCDMRFPAEAAMLLLARNLPVVGANYRHRQPPHQATAFMGLGTPNYRLDLDDKARGVAQVASIGFGVCLMAREVFDKLPAPWFVLTPAETEDIGFGRACLRADIPIHVDLDLSKMVRHIGLSEV